MAQSPKLRATRWWWVMKPTHSTRKEMLDFNPTVRYQRDLTTTSNLARHSYWNLTFSTPRLGWPWTVRRNRRHSSFPQRRYFSATKRYDLSSFYTKSEVSAEGLPWEVGRETGIPKDVSRFVSKNSRWPAHKTTFPFRLPAGGQKMCRPMAMLASSNPGHKNYRNQKELILPIRLSPALWSNRGRIQYYSLKIPHEYWKLYRYAEMRDCMLY